MHSLNFIVIVCVPVFQRWISETLCKTLTTLKRSTKFLNELSSYIWSDIILLQSVSVVNSVILVKNAQRERDAVVSGLFRTRSFQRLKTDLLLLLGCEPRAAEVRRKMIFLSVWQGIIMIVSGTRRNSFLCAEQLCTIFL
jgi:hypothetical protein